MTKVKEAKKRYKGSMGKKDDSSTIPSQPAPSSVDPNGIENVEDFLVPVPDSLSPAPSWYETDNSGE